MRGSAGLRLNQVYSSAFSNVTTSDGCPESDGNCPNGGDSLLLTQSSFNTFQGSFSQAKNGVRLAVGYNFANVFTSPDLGEESRIWRRRGIVNKMANAANATPARNRKPARKPTW